jgi:hypothetical protein
VRPGHLPPAEEGLRRLRLPGRPDAALQLVREGEQEEDHGHRPDALPHHRPQVRLLQPVLDLDPSLRRRFRNGFREMTVATKLKKNA